MFPFSVFPELASVSLRDERAGEGVGFLAEDPAYELASRGDVAPLVASSHLQGASLVLIEPEVVVALEQLVCEFSE